MRFVDDKDFVAIARGPIADVFAQLSHLINTPVRRGVDFDDVRRRAERSFKTTGADAAGIGGGALNAVEAASHDARDGGFSGASLAGKDVAVGDTALGDSVFKGGFDVFLADQLGKRLRPVLASDDLVHEGDYARPRVIRGTRVKPLPLLPSGPGGVCSRPLHEARSLTIHQFIRYAHLYILRYRCTI